MFQQLLPQVEGEIVGGKIVPGEQNDRQDRTETTNLPSHRSAVSYFISPAFASELAWLAP